MEAKGGHTLDALLSVGDQLRDPELLPWVPQADGVFFKPLRVDREHGTWTNLLRVTRQGTVSRHRHLAPVEAWVISGEWRYLERDWVARPGTYIFEPEGDIHTLVNNGEATMVTLFCIHGPIEYLGPGGEVVFTETAETKLAKYVQFCQAHDLPLAAVVG
ncbi:MAG TPA: 2,4'-dihydroxyacetophenone dioxygenase family protein [Acidimicrobiales bacterium]|nr:2,4'-dihydroxyacetophenone dioxygenase family protein [Acidimicrobiales bacterium]